MKQSIGQASNQLSGTTKNTALEDRPITGTGVYDFSSKFENLELNDSDNYSDEDFYSDEFEQPEVNQDYEDRDDDDFELGQTVVQKGGLSEVVDIYQKYLGNQEFDGQGGTAVYNEQFDQYEFSQSFVNQQRKVQEAYGEDTEIYKTLNPKHS